MTMVHRAPRTRPPLIGTSVGVELPQRLNYSSFDAASRGPSAQTHTHAPAAVVVVVCRARRHCLSAAPIARH